MGGFTVATFFKREELPLWDSVNAEVQRLVGTAADYFRINKIGSTRDEVYDEPNLTEGQAWEFAEPVAITCILQEWAEIKDAGDRGLEQHWEARCWLSRKMMDDAEIDPQEGDVIVVWGERSGVGGGWDIIQVNEEGFLGDNPVPTQFVLDLRRRTKYLPERKKPAVQRSTDAETDRGRELGPRVAGGLS